MSRKATKRALVVSHNWKTGETLTEPFTGPGAADKAAGWVHKKNFLWRDFPKSQGWEHFAWWNEAAAEERGERIGDDLAAGRGLTEKVIL